MGPVVVGPYLKGGKGLIERPTEIGELVQRGGVNARRIEVPRYKAVAFSASEGVS
jgi:hypothetical protein